jgi:hypothetical protein
MLNSIKTRFTGKTARFLAVALRPEIVGRATGTAAVIGTVLAAINHGPELLGLQVGARRALQIGLTYLVPYCVATYAATMQELRHDSEGRRGSRDRSGPPVVRAGVLGRPRTEASGPAAQ